MDICESFLNAYRDLEEVLAVKYGQRAGTVQMFASGEGAKYFEELNLFREMRNLLSHHGRIDGSPVVLPSEQALEKLLEILDELHPDVDFETEEHLIDNKILDSFDIVTLVAEIDAEYDVAIPAEELIPENFNSAKALYALVEKLMDE